MILSKAKRMLAHASIAELQEIRRYTSERIAELTRRNKASAQEQAWAATGKKAKTGMFMLLSAPAGCTLWRSENRNPAHRKYAIFKGGEIYKVVHVQPRKKLLWVVDHAGDFWGFTPQSLAEFGNGATRLFPDELSANIAKVKLCGGGA